MFDACTPRSRRSTTRSAADGDAARRSPPRGRPPSAGRDDTIPMVARKGRASYLGERSAGHQDPGATSAALLFEAAAERLRRVRS